MTVPPPSAVSGRDRWLGPVAAALRTRAGRKAGDPARILRDISRGAATGVGVRLRGRRVLLITDPSLIGPLLIDHAADTTKGPGVQLTRPVLGDGLLTSEGEKHRRTRRLVGAAFSPRRLAGYTETFGACALATSNRWQDGQDYDLHQEMATLALDIVGRALLGVDLSDRSAGIRASLDVALKRFAGGALPLFGRRPPTNPPVAGELAEGIAAVHQQVDRIIAARRLDLSSDRGDVVSALLLATDADSGASLTDSEVHDNVMTLMMAGHETTANALSWTWLLLGEHPEVAERLGAEVDQLHGRAPSFDELPQLTYTRAVVTEAMRLYPPAWILGRSATIPLELGGWKVPAGTTIGVSPLLLHHDPRWFPDPEVFDPDRWLDERAQNVPKHAFLPFGSGPRSCIGEQFAWAEAVTVLAVLAARWTVSPLPGPRPEPYYRVTLRPAGGVPMRLRARQISGETRQISGEN